MYDFTDAASRFENLQYGISGIYNFEIEGNVDDTLEEIGQEFHGTENDYIKVSSSILQTRLSAEAFIVYLRVVVAEFVPDQYNYLLRSDDVIIHYSLTLNTYMNSDLE